MGINISNCSSSVEKLKIKSKRPAQYITAMFSLRGQILTLINLHYTYSFLTSESLVMRLSSALTSQLLNMKGIFSLEEEQPALVL